MSIKVGVKCMCCTSSDCISLTQGEPGKTGEKGLVGRPGLRVSHVTNFQQTCIFRLLGLICQQTPDLQTTLL